MGDMKDGSEYVNRQNYKARFDATSRFSRRLKSKDRPVPPAENTLPPDKPLDQFTTVPRVNQ